MCLLSHYNDVTMGSIASQITSLTIVYSAVYSGADQRKHQSSASLAFVCGINTGPVNSPHKWPITRKMFPFDDVIMVRYRSMSSISFRVNPLTGRQPNDCPCASEVTDEYGQKHIVWRILFTRMWHSYSWNGTEQVDYGSRSSSFVVTSYTPHNGENSFTICMDLRWLRREEWWRQTYRYHECYDTSSQCFKVITVTS